MKIKSSKVNNKNKAINKKIDTIYMNTGNLFCYNKMLNINKTPNVKNIEISKNLADAIGYVIKIYDSSACTLHIEDSDNFGDITIPIITFLNNCVHLEINNNEVIKNNFKKINITRGHNIIVTINLDENLSRINIQEDFDELVIETRNDKEIIQYIIKRNGEYNKYFKKYNISKDDLDKDGNLDIRELLKYEFLICESMDINTLIIDKNIFKNLKKLKKFETNKKKFYKTNIKNIRIIENNDMKLIPFDKTFEIEEFILNDTGKKYLYIKTKDDEVVIYMDKDSNLKYISKNELLKDPEIKNVYFRFRKETKCNGEVYKPLSFIIKEYKDSRLKLNNLFKEIELDDNFKQNITFKIDKLSKLHFVYLNCINNNDYLNLLNLPEFSDEILNKLFKLHSECETTKNNIKKSGLSSKAIEYLTYRGILEKISEIKLSELEINKFNELGESYKKILKK